MTYVGVGAGNSVPLKLGGFQKFLTFIQSEKYKFHVTIYICN